MKLTALARGRPCTIRLPGCNGGGESTVAAHFRSQRIGAGMGIKPPDLFIAFACNRCHDRVDNRNRIHDGSDVKHAHLMGVLETQKWLLDEGYIRFGSKA